MSVELGAVVCRRNLRTPDGAGVEVALGMPQPYSSGSSYYCPYQVVGIGDDGVHSAAGVDSMQALLHALQRVHAKLKGSDLGKTGELHWVDGDEVVDDGDNFGFPAFFPKY